MKRLILAALVATVPGMTFAEGEGHKCFSPPFAGEPPVRLSSEQSAFLKGL